MSQTKPTTEGGKKEVSYTYWVDDKNKSRDLPEQHRPKKIEAPVQNQPNNASNTDGPSAWNSCGTWEEKKISMAQIENNLTNILNQWIGKQQLDSIILGEVKLEGQVSKIFKRNKWNIMYQLKGSVEFKEAEKEQKQEGKDGKGQEKKKQKAKKAKVKFIELTDHGDRQFQIKGDNEVKKKLNGGQIVVKMLEEVIAKYRS